MSQSLSVPPFFDGSNYAYWKVRMRAFLKSLDEHVWISVQNGWKPPSSIVSGNIHLTDISLWTKDELAACNWNSKGIHALFMALSPEEFRRVSMCETAKEVWDILETTHEGTKIVKNSKLQMLASRFEEVRMKDDETFDEFYAKLNDIVNSSFNLGERIPETKIVRKVLRSLPERFRPKVTAIEESKDLDEVKIEELVGSLQTYELTLSQHQCGALGHTRSRCYKLGNERRSQNIPSQVSFLSNQVSHLTEMLTKLTKSNLSPKRIWVKKGDLIRLSGQEKCLVANVALKAQNSSMWYLDSACSRHMCGNKSLFTTLDECNGGMVTFGDGGSAPILGKGTVQMLGLPVISNVLYVEGLKSNLLSISQICDDDFEVSFVQKRCTVYDSSGGVVLEGVRTSDNCYGVLPNSNYVAIGENGDEN
ncbi:uncharacterized protein LOC111388180 [Olea europaea var. sylvestris]|uniref:uncharacterized protein LOC111388180 n=1 Tax=Olea europaea var. sylvestris TaxID=158386 RepID=UPI000C1CE657|nr:uncharacterized protein LOC111388180 [Olea europaea var. sylvestris]